MTITGLKAFYSRWCTGITRRFRGTRLRHFKRERPGNVWHHFGRCYPQGTFSRWSSGTVTNFSQSLHSRRACSCLRQKLKRATWSLQSEFSQPWRPLVSAQGCGTGATSNSNAPSRTDNWTGNFLIGNRWQSRHANYCVGGIGDRHFYIRDIPRASPARVYGRCRKWANQSVHNGTGLCHHGRFPVDGLRRCLYQVNCIELDRTGQFDDNGANGDDCFLVLKSLNLYRLPINSTNLPLLPVYSTNLCK